MPYRLFNEWVCYWLVSCIGNECEDGMSDWEHSNHVLILWINPRYTSSFLVWSPNEGKCALTAYATRGMKCKWLRVITSSFVTSMGMVVACGKRFRSKGLFSVSLNMLFSAVSPYLKAATVWSFPRGRAWTTKEAKLYKRTMSPSTPRVEARQVYSAEEMEELVFCTVNLKWLC